MHFLYQFSYKQPFDNVGQRAQALIELGVIYVFGNHLIGKEVMLCNYGKMKLKPMGPIQIHAPFKMTHRFCQQFN